MHSPTSRHLNAIYHILRYRKGTLRNGLMFKKNEDRRVQCFVDTNWVGSLEDNMSTSRYCTKVWGNLVTWRSKKQSVVSRSNVEAKYRAIPQDICEMIWLGKLMEDL